MALLAIISISFSILNGCDDSGNVTAVQSDSGVVHFDSIGVVDGIGNVMNSINLYAGTTVERDSSTKDANLNTIDTVPNVNYILRSGDLIDLYSRVQGFQTRFNRIYASMTQAEFDTITIIPVNRDTILPDLDFTADDTYGGGAWGYFNAPMSTSDLRPVYSFWLKGKSANFIGRNVYGILIPREATIVGGTYRMSFEVKINVKGYNYFFHAH
ncbi:MAG: hypothetical protein ABI543_10185 [Ignavibacteria bacterium]